MIKTSNLKLAAEFAALYTKGSTLAQIAARYNCYPATVGRYLKELGCSRRRKGRARLFTREQQKDIIYLKKQGWKVSAIARKYKTSAATICRYLKLPLEYYPYDTRKKKKIQEKQGRIEDKALRGSKS